ncbi:MAG TPA: efflux RND transporter permease subunit [Candidatus Krumholzibacteria bacterium]|nr:efflux RND transporter permease subunit [Candidatus Krumholzibacteria bacterium]
MIIQTAVRRPVAILMLFAGLVLIGAMAMKRLPIDLLPSINYPNLTVITNWADTPADDLTRLVTQPLEEVITGLAGVRRVVSKTREGVSTITVQYEWGTEMDFANLHLREAIDRVAYRDDFPSGADRPLILRWDPSARPIAILVLHGDDPIAEMTDFAREVVKPALEQINGVSQAEVIGGAEREILVEPDFGKLRLYNLTMDDLATALRVANISFPGGRIRKGPLHLPLRILGEFENLDEIRATEIPAAGPGITIGDVAQVLDTTKEPEGFTLTGTDEVVSLHLYKEVGENTITTTAEIDKVLGILGGQYPDFSCSFIYRDADFVQESFDGLKSSLLYGSALAFAVLFLALMDWRSPIVVGLAIPVSIMTTLAFLYFAKVGLNLMSLGGLSLAAGMLVDNSIVVLENINRHLKEARASGASVADICASAAQEVASPVVAATLTTVAVFFPVIYVPGVAGEFFRDQALTVTISLLVSILAALLLQPMLSAHILKAPGDRPAAIYRPFDAFVRMLIRRYHAALVPVLEHKAAFVAVVVIALAACGWLGSQLRLTFMPDRTRGDFTLALELPAGTPLEVTHAAAHDLAAYIAPMPEVETVYAQVGVTEKTLASLKEYSAANTARIRVMLHPSRHGRRDMEHIKERLAGRLAAREGAVWAFREEGVGLREILASGEAAFTLGITAERGDDALKVADDLLPKLHRIRGLEDVEMDRVLGNPTVEVTVDREKALRYGLEPDALAGELRNRIQGTVATTYNEIEQRIDIAVRLPRDERYDLGAVLASPVAVTGGKTVPLGTFVIQTIDQPVREVVRRDQRRQLTLAGDVNGRSLAEVWTDVDALLARTVLPEGVSFVTGGEQEEINSSFHDLGWALLLSALLVYMILAAQFESFIDPLIITAVLPVGVGGALLTLWLTGQSLNIISLIGMIALLGIAVNDAIVKVATIRRLREDGMGGREAVLAAGELRFRPIMMTTVTTVLAMVPMGLGLGTGEQMQRPLAITIIGGLSVATLLTLYLTPLVYEAVHRRLDREY